jgi:hypothetical protein
MVLTLGFDRRCPSGTCQRRPPARRGRGPDAKIFRGWLTRLAWCKWVLFRDFRNRLSPLTYSSQHRASARCVLRGVSARQESAREVRTARIVARPTPEHDRGHVLATPMELRGRREGSTVDVSRGEDWPAGSDVLFSIEPSKHVATMPDCLIGLGSNLGDRAYQRIGRRVTRRVPGVTVSAVGNCTRRPRGDTRATNYLNGAAGPS